MQLESGTFSGCRRKLVLVAVAFSVAVSLLIALAFPISFLLAPSQVAAQAKPADQLNQELGVGVNLGNALEAPTEGDWGLKIEPEYLRLIKEAGFKHVRIPTRWSAHALKEPPYTVDAKFFSRVDEVVQQVLENKLDVVLNMHHYEELEAAPDNEQARFLAIWQQIGEHFRQAPKQVAFEIYNEPCKALNEDKWNKLFVEALHEIRASNPERVVVVGPVSWNNIHKLSDLKVPDDDQRLIVTVHYYEPFHFTHQGASWAGDESEKWLGTKWLGSDEEKSQINLDFDFAQKWGKEHGRPIYLGEFGAYSKGDMDSRARWTRYVREAGSQRGFSMAYWEFGAGFGVYDPQEKTWRRPLLDALVGR